MGTMNFFSAHVMDNQLMEFFFRFFCSNLVAKLQEKKKKKNLISYKRLCWAEDKREISLQNIQV